ncbi:hypothetical protein TGGT1_408750 [Toxoplasma gondii GT1]|uniref:Uncharacterized protein n=1 Tax=Toxoplasma gondii (strain ATCC 50853 / GT1) TaxID=507601 RepID=S7WFP4_TOXGG|nr:hypothetical protein TGGT1_408750 [Toxoplasma gondii GT1]
MERQESRVTRRRGLGASGTPVAVGHLAARETMKHAFLPLLRRMPLGRKRRRYPAFAEKSPTSNAGNRTTAVAPRRAKRSTRSREKWTRRSMRPVLSRPHLRLQAKRTPQPSVGETSRQPPLSNPVDEREQQKKSKAGIVAVTTPHRGTKRQTKTPNRKWAY